MSTTTYEFSGLIPPEFTLTDTGENLIMVNVTIPRRRSFGRQVRPVIARGSGPNRVRVMFQ